MSHPALGPAAAEAAQWSWTLEPLVIVPVAVTAVVYVRGWIAVRTRLPERFGAARLAAFLAGLAALVVAVCPPLDALGHRWLRAHMAQHIVLMLIAPPLLWLGAPLAPLLSGLPRRLRRIVATTLAGGPVRSVTGVLADPRVAWLTFAAAFWIWHLPAFYELALAAEGWHRLEHACFVFAGLVFWWPVVAPWPSTRVWTSWAMVAYLVLAEAQAMVLSAILTFADRVIYPSYATPAPSGHLSPIEDQALAGVLMWVPGSIPFTIALLALVFRGLSIQPRSPSLAAPPAATRPTATNGSTATSSGERS